MASEIRVDTSKNASGLCTVTYSNTGAVLSGITTGTFSGDITGNVTGNISGGTVAGSTGTFTDKIGINKTSPAGWLHIHQADSGTTDGIVITNTSTTNNGLMIGVNSTEDAFFWNGSNTNTTFATNNTERLRINSSGKTILHGGGATGTNNTSTILDNGNTLNVHGTSSSDGISVVRYSANYGAYGINIGKSRNNTFGTNTLVNDGNELGHISFYGADGTDFEMAAQITGLVDGSPSDGTDMPGALSFRTSAEASATPTERLLITSDGRTLINTTAVTNTNDQLTVKRPAGSWTEMSMTVDANTSTSSAANALIFTKSKHTYWNGYAFESSHGYIGALLGKRDSAGTSDQEIRLEIGGDSPNQNEEKTWTFRNSGNLALSAGNIEFASGYGIDFSSTGGGSGTSNDSEILTDYEHGEWTPVIHHYISGSFSAPTYSAAGTVVGRYTKIGNMVHISASFLGFNISNAHGSSFARVTGLPFTSTNHANNRDVISTCSDAFTTDGVNFSTYWNQTNLNSMKHGTGVFDWAVFSGGSAHNLVISGHYTAA